MHKIVIIGASSGIGRQVALDFARAGMRVGIAARREEPLRKMKEQYPENITYATLDVTDDDAAERFLNLVERNGGADTVLIAAGTGRYNPRLDTEYDLQTVAVNVDGFVRIANAAYKYLRDTCNGAPGLLAAITSVASTKGLGVAASYSASKRFQRTYIEALEQLATLQHARVRFTEVRPGFVDTALLSDDRRYPMMMDVEYAAHLTELAMLRRQRVATIDLRWALVTALWSLIPRCLWTRLPIHLSD